MLHSPTNSDDPLSRFRVRPHSSRGAIRDAVIVAAVCVAAWVLIERTDACTRFFQFVSANPDLELDSILLAGIFSAIGLLVFALRRWSEAANAQRRANSLAYNDALTGLPNRRAFIEGLEHATQQDGLRFACLLFDLDDFKQVNDLRGHLTGDQVLQTVSQRLSQSLAPDVLLARIGGDEFALLVPSNDSDQLSMADLVVQSVGEPLRLDGHEVQVGVSVGLARFPDDANRADALLRKADIALYRAKALGRSAVRRFEPSMEEEDLRHAAIADALRDAIPRGEIAAHYQPIVELATGSVIAFEALARWTSPRLGEVARASSFPSRRSRV